MKPEPAAPETVVTPAPSRTGRRVVATLAVLVLLAGGGLFLTRKKDAGGGPDAKGAGGPPGAKGGAERKVPVLVEPAARRDVPIVLEGLGTVTPLYTVQVRSQVDGRLDSVRFKEGAVVKKGELLAQIDPRPFLIAVAQASATLARDQAQLRNGKLMLQRDQELRKQDLVSQQTVDDQQTLVDQYEATVGIDQAVLENAKLQLDYSHLVAPVDAVAGIRQIDPGNIVHAADPTGLVVLTQLDPIAVIFTLPQDELARLQGALALGPLSVEAWARDGQALLGSGTLTVIDNQINASTGTVRLKAVFPNPTRALWPNQFVKAKITVAQKKDALVVAAAAIQRGPKGTFVYVAMPDNTAQVRPVEVEAIEGPLAVLRASVDEGERVITDGQSQLKPGAAIDPRVGVPSADSGGHP